MKLIIGDSKKVINFIKSLNKDELIWFIPFVPFLVYLLAIVFLGTSSWYHNENLERFTRFLAYTTSDAGNDFLSVFNLNIFELGEPRPTRFLGNYLDVINFRLRHILSYIMPMHPSFSVMWLVSLVLIPYFFVKSAYVKGYRWQNITLFVSFLLVQPGVIHDLVVFFRANKGLVNLGLIYSFYLSVKWEHEKLEWRHGLIFSFVVLMTMYCDETGTLLFPGLVILNFRFFRNLKIAIPFLLLPILYFVSVFYIFPYLHFLPDNSSLPELSDYDHYIRIIENFKFAFNNLLIHAQLFASDSFGIWSLESFKPIPLLSVMSLLALVFLNFKKDISAKFLLRITFILFFLISLIYFHSWIMSVKEQIWSLFWYGNFFSIFLLLFIMELFGDVQLRRISIVFVLIINFSVLYRFYHTNEAYKYYHVYDSRPPELVKVFMDEELRFKSYLAYEYPELISVFKIRYNLSLNKDIGFADYGTPLDNPDRLYPFRFRYLQLERYGLD